MTRFTPARLRPEGQSDGPGHRVCMTDTATRKLRDQLRVLLHLTQAEAQLASVRVAQARTDAVRRELTQNSKHAEERSRLIAEALTDLGGQRDVLAPVLGRVSALVKTVAEQIEPVSEALLQDLQLEHQLLDRARYAKVLATAAERPRIVTLAERLIGAHTATVEWLTTVLAEEALGGPTALASTPLQRAAGAAGAAVLLPNRLAVASVNRSVHTVTWTARQARSRAHLLGGRASGFADGAREVLLSGRDASLKRAEAVAEREGNPDAAAAVHETRRNVGALDTAELPIKKYDELNNTDAIAAVRKLDDVQDLRAVLAYEEAHKARVNVISAAQTRTAAIAKDVAGV
ncbi:MAG: uncharacterized protein JWL64_1852 [Frankiales bacterium]|nr:uncharacterized protein [Frankiales bacterium]